MNQPKSTDENPFEPSETREQQDRRVGRTIRENADKRMHVEYDNSTRSMISRCGKAWWEYHRGKP